MWRELKDKAESADVIECTMQFLVLVLMHSVNLLAHEVSAGRLSKQP